MSRRAKVARRMSALLAVALAAGALASCGSSHTTTTRTSSSVTLDAQTRADAQRALDRAIAWSARELHATDAFTLVLVDYLYRRYDIEAFADARAIAVRAIADEQPATQPELRLLRPSVRPSEASVRDTKADPSARLVAGALACDEPGVPPDFDALLDSAIGHGGYELTHSAVAIAIETTLGCPPTGGARLRARVIAALATAVAHDTGASDISIERMAMLSLLNAASDIPATRLPELLATQQPDGGWAGPDVATRAHTTALAIWTLSAALGLRGDAQAGLVFAG